jgi:hypothetical protein
LAGETAVGGGGSSNADAAIKQSVPLHDGDPATGGQIPNGWGASAENGEADSTTVYVLCAAA